MIKRQEGILEKLSKYGLIEFYYITGGTALSLRYHHRISEDLDFFSFPEYSEEAFPLERTIVIFQKAGGKIISLERGTIWGEISGINVSFFSCPYSLLEPPLKICGFPAASDKDIAASKLVSIAQRGAKRDFFDLWFVLRKHNWNLATLLEFCRQKYRISSEHNTIFLKSLVYFEDAEKQCVFLKEDKPLSEKDWAKIKDFFQKLVKDFCRSSN